MQVIKEEGSRPIKAWVGSKTIDYPSVIQEDGSLAAGRLTVPDMEDAALQQLKNIARLPFIHPNGVAVMPDVHLGKGATVGSVIATTNAICPAAVGVDLGCGMVALRLSLKASQLPDSLLEVRHQIERDVPTGRGQHGPKYVPPGHEMNQGDHIHPLWSGYNHGPVRALFGDDGFRKAWFQLGTLGSGNHFIELCTDENEDVWVMLHSGSRGIGNMIGSHYIAEAKRDMERYHISLPDADLAYLPEDTQKFKDYVEAVQWAQGYALENRRVMLQVVLQALHRRIPTPFTVTDEAINCFAGDTKVMTMNGPVPIAELSGEEHDVLTTGGRWVKAPFASFGEQRIVELHLSRSGVEKVIRTTAKHAWLTRTRSDVIVRKTTEELKKGDRLQFVFPARPNHLYVGSDGVRQGFVYGDGSVQGRWSVANFCGSKDDALLPFFSDYEVPREYPQFKRILHLPKDWKLERPDLRFDDHDHLYGWLAGYFAADGDVDKTGRPTLASADRDDLEYVRQLCTVLGIGTFGIRTRMRKGFGDVETPLYMVGLMRSGLCQDFFIIPAHRERFEAGRNAAERRGWNVVKVVTTDTWEEVFCATVPDTHAFALEDNILTGNCHHNYIDRENHFGSNLWVTRKGAIRAREGDLGIIPGSMGQKSYIVKGKGNHESYCSCSHGAGRNFSRTEAKRRFSLVDLVAQTEGVECRKDAEVLDEIPGAYKSLDLVMANQSDLVDVVHTLKAVLCVKGN